MRRLWNYFYREPMEAILPIDLRPIEPIIAQTVFQFVSHAEVLKFGLVGIPLPSLLLGGSLRSIPDLDVLPFLPFL